MRLRKYLALAMIATWLLGSLKSVEAGAEVFAYNDQGKMDPFVSLVSPTGEMINFEGEKELSIADMILEGIVAGGDENNIAIINGVIVKPNDKIGPFTIEKIEANAVILRKAQEQFVIKLRKEE